MNCPACDKDDVRRGNSFSFDKVRVCDNCQSNWYDEINNGYTFHITIGNEEYILWGSNALEATGYTRLSIITSFDYEPNLLISIGFMIPGKDYDTNKNIIEKLLKLKAFA
jgi:hypothetical protein